MHHASARRRGSSPERARAHRLREQRFLLQSRRVQLERPGRGGPGGREMHHQVTDGWRKPAGALSYMFRGSNYVINTFNGRRCPSLVVSFAARKAAWVATCQSHWLISPFAGCWVAHHPPFPCQMRSESEPKLRRRCTNNHEPANAHPIWSGSLPTTTPLTSITCLPSTPNGRHGRDPRPPGVSLSARPCTL